MLEDLITNRKEQREINVPNAVKREISRNGRQPGSIRIGYFPVLLWTTGGVGLYLYPLYAAIIFGIIAFLILVLYALNHLSYSILKERVLFRQKWDLNICCGMTDGGGVNADILRHADIPNFIEIKDIYNLPFEDREFSDVLCSHTMEHVDNPIRFYNELRRVGERVTIIIPPLWDISAALNILEHRSVFLTFRKEHAILPKYIRLPFARSIQGLLGQRIKA